MSDIHPKGHYRGDLHPRLDCREGVLNPAVVRSQGQVVDSTLNKCQRAHPFQACDYVMCACILETLGKSCESILVSAEAEKVTFFKRHIVTRTDSLQEECEGPCDYVWRLC